MEGSHFDFEEQIPLQCTELFQKINNWLNYQNDCLALFKEPYHLFCRAKSFIPFDDNHLFESIRSFFFFHVRFARDNELESTTSIMVYDMATKEILMNKQYVESIPSDTVEFSRYQFMVLLKVCHELGHAALHKFFQMHDIKLIKDVNSIEYKGVLYPKSFPELEVMGEFGYVIEEHLILGFVITDAASLDNVCSKPLTIYIRQKNAVAESPLNFLSYTVSDDYISHILSVLGTTNISICVQLHALYFHSVKDSIVKQKRNFLRKFYNII